MASKRANESLDLRIWDQLIEFCLKNGLRFFFDGTGEPWFSTGAVSTWLQWEEKTTENKVAGLPRHPIAAGLVRLSDLGAKYDPKTPKKGP